MENYINFTTLDSISTTTTISDISYNYISGTSIVNNLSYYYNYLPYQGKNELVKNILDQVIEIKSLVDNYDYEAYEIKKISFYKNKSKIICTKEIDLVYFDELQKNSQIINEFIDQNIDEYKEKTLQFVINSIKEVKKEQINWLYNGTSNSNYTINYNGNSSITLCTQDSVKPIYYNNNTSYTV